MKQPERSKDKGWKESWWQLGSWFQHFLRAADMTWFLFFTEIAIPKFNCALQIPFNKFLLLVKPVSRLSLTNKSPDKNFYITFLSICSSHSPPFPSNITAGNFPTISLLCQSGLSALVLSNTIYLWPLWLGLGTKRVKRKEI